MLLLKTLADTTDREIYDRLTQLDPENTFVTERVVQAIADAKRFGVVSSEQGLVCFCFFFKFVSFSFLRLFLLGLFGKEVQIGSQSSSPIF